MSKLLTFFVTLLLKKELNEYENIYSIRKVKQEFVNVFAQKEDAHASNYRTFCLKERLQERFPEWIFHVSKE